MEGKAKMLKMEQAVDQSKENILRSSLSKQGTVEEKEEPNIRGFT